MIIVFGTNILDLFFHLKDLPPKDTAIHLENHVEQPGGKGANQAVAAAKAGAEVRFFGALGEGGHGRQMYKNLASCNIDVSGIKFLDTPSGLATIFVDEGDGTHKVVVSQGANLLAKQDWVPERIVGPQSIVLVQGELPMSETEALVKRASSKGARSVMNMAPIVPLSDELLNALDVIVLNVHEADGLGAQLGLDTSDKTIFARTLYDRYHLATIVTLGHKGAVCCFEEGAFRISALPIKAVDTIGAGDAFVGFFCAALDQGKDFLTALKEGAVAGSLACTKVGAQSALPDADEVRNQVGKIQIFRVTEENVPMMA